MTPFIWDSAEVGSKNPTGQLVGGGGAQLQEPSAQRLSLRPSGETQQHGARAGPPGPASRPDLPLAAASCDFTCLIYILLLWEITVPSGQMIPTV